jgi:hypothetical protein
MRENVSIELMEIMKSDKCENSIIQTAINLEVSKYLEGFGREVFCFLCC